MIGKMHIVEFIIVIAGLYYVLKKEEDSFSGLKVVAYWLITIGIGVVAIIRQGGLL